jgi:hypothetical protein
MPLSSVLGAQSLVRPGVCTSSTRPASPFEGQVIYETDTKKTLVYNGSAWGIISDVSGWTTYTPTITASTNPNLGSTGSITGKYQQIGRTVFGRITFSFGGTGISAGSGGYSFLLPVTAATSGFACGSGVAQDDNTQARTTFTVYMPTTTTVLGFYTAASGFPTIGSAAPWTWATGDFGTMSFTYEAA